MFAANVTVDEGGLVFVEACATAIDARHMLQLFETL